uniref:Uncharacterized protein n=1 Tax=Anguilla anguilla TaxID=7936 RepID=A0A0E9QCX1_ANGAN
MQAVFGRNAKCSSEELSCLRVPFVCLAFSLPVLFCCIIVLWDISCKKDVT